MAIAARPDRIFRIDRPPDPWTWRSWSTAGRDSTFGGRWDDPDGLYRVQYASSQRRGAFLETLGKFRPDPDAAATEIDGEPLGVPPLPRTWLQTHVLGEARVEGGYFADIGHSDSLAHLRSVMAARLVHYHVDDIDASTIRSTAPRALTQEMSRIIFQTVAADEETFSGIRYLSRLGDEIANWAIFESGRASLLDRRPRAIAEGDEDLRATLELFHIRLG